MRADSRVDRIREAGWFPVQGWSDSVLRNLAVYVPLPVLLAIAVGLAPQTVAVVFTDTGDRGAATGLPAALADPLNVRGAFSDGDDGRLPDSVAPATEGAFRTPPLRCLARRPSYMHTGQLRTIEDVVAFFDQGGHPGGYPGTNELHALALTDAEKAALAAFLRTLEGPGPAEALLAPPP